jgi:hypothetical protein
MIRTYLYVLGLLAVACAGLQGTALAADQVLPSKMIFFVEGTTCPAGSVPATDAAGRMLLVTTNLGDVGKTYGKPLTDQEDRTHTHAGTMQVDLPSHHIAGASSCCNDQGTTAGNHSASVTSGAGTSGLPFIQLLVCQVK